MHGSTRVSCMDGVKRGGHLFFSFSSPRLIMEKYQLRRIARCKGEGEDNHDQTLSPYRFFLRGPTGDSGGVPCGAVRSAGRLHPAEREPGAISVVHG